MAKRSVTSDTETQCHVILGGCEGAGNLQRVIFWRIFGELSSRRIGSASVSTVSSQQAQRRNTPAVYYEDESSNQRNIN